MTTGTIRSQSEGRAPKGGALDHGRGPVLIGAVLTVLLVGGLVGAVAGGLPANIAAHAKSASVSEDDNQTTDGVETPTNNDPIITTTPDRDSDQGGASSGETKEPPVKDEVYFIQPGDTLTALSARFGMSIDYLAEYNAVRDVNVISEGAALRVPFVYIPPEGWTPEQG